jgi:glycosyltransferase involved in cell wall biosynthesis
MRILHVTDVYRPRVGGIELFVEELAARQARAGHDVAVLTQTGGAETTTPDGVRVLRSPFAGVVPPGIPFDARPGYASYDVVHAHLSVVSPFATRALQSADAAGVATVATVHSIWTGRGGWVRVVGAIAGWRGWSTRWTAVSQAAADSVRALIAADVAVVPNAVDVPWWSAVPPVVEDRPFTISTVMRLAGRKRPLELLDVLAAMDELVPDLDWRAVVVGDGPLLPRVRRQVAELGLEDHVELRGQLSREEVREVYRRSDVYVAPALRESFGLAPLEARSIGVPVVAMRSGGVGEFVRSGREGLLCDDDADLAGALVHLATDRVALAELTTFNSTHAPTHGWDRTLEGFAEEYAAARTRAPRAARQPR